ncbi:MAG: T9SS type A sorting domain-containing protein [Ignavibacteria bacterium]|nr:T9SS type A sorting domain-containing protein [Ignavibacteria bacterium]
MDTTGCDRWSENFLVGTTSVFENESGSIVTLYPNPTQGQVTIAGAAGAEITITDMLGRVVVRLQNATDLQLVSIDGANGTYAVTLRSGNAVHTVLVTKQ